MSKSGYLTFEDLRAMKDGSVEVLMEAKDGCMYILTDKPDAAMLKRVQRGAPITNRLEYECLIYGAAKDDTKIRERLYSMSESDAPVECRVFHSALINKSNPLAEQRPAVH